MADRYEPRPADHPPKRILLVEDHVDTARSMGWLLSRAGYAVAIVHSAAAALAEAARDGFDVVISDIGLPDSSGYELMRLLQQNHQLAGIALSGYDDAAQIAQGHAAGFVEHIVKPVDFQRLKDALQRVLAGAESAP